MEIKIEKYTKVRINDVIDFELQLRKEEDFWGWEIDEEYIKNVENSFSNLTFTDSLSFLAYVDNKVVGRIDSSMISTHFDGSTKAYLDWICVLKSYRHHGVAQSLLKELRFALKNLGITTLIALTASNDEAVRFYKSIPDSIMRDTGIWIDIK